MSSTIDRREAVRRVAAILGTTLSAPAVAGVLGGCSAEDHTSSEMLTGDRQSIVRRLADIIIPATDTPGAAKANVDQFIDLMLTEWYPRDKAKQFLSGLDVFLSRFEKHETTSFEEAPRDRQAEFLAELDAAVFSGKEEDPIAYFHRTLKELTLLGYYTSEIGMTQELQWVAAPGYYNGCMPLEEAGRTWV